MVGFCERLSVGCVVLGFCERLSVGPCIVFFFCVCVRLTVDCVVRIL